MGDVLLFPAVREPVALRLVEPLPSRPMRRRVGALAGGATLFVAGLLGHALTRPHDVEPVPQAPPVTVAVAVVPAPTRIPSAPPRTLPIPAERPELPITPRGEGVLL